MNLIIVLIDRTTPASNILGLEDEYQQQLQALKGKLDGVIPYFKTSVLFSSYTGITPGTDPLNLNSHSEPAITI